MDTECRLLKFPRQSVIKGPSQACFSCGTAPKHRAQPDVVLNRYMIKRAAPTTVHKAIKGTRVEPAAPR